MTIPVKVSNVAEGAVAALSQAVRTFLFENSPKVDLSKGHRAAVLHLGEIDDLSSAPAGLTTRLETADAYLFPLLSTDAPEGEGDIVGYVEVRGTDNPVARVGDGLYENRVSDARKAS